MANPSQGMLGNLFNSGYAGVRQEELDEEKRMQALSAMDGFQADRLATYEGANMLGKGLGSLAASAAGRDPRTPAKIRADAIEAAKAQVMKLGFDPERDSDQFYIEVMRALQKQGLIPEMMAIRKEWQEEKAALAKEKLGTDKLALEKEDLERKALKDQLDYDAKLAKIESLTKVGVPLKNATKLTRLFAEREALSPSDPNLAAKRAAYDKAIQVESSGKVAARDLGGVSELYNTSTGQPVRTTDKTLPPRDEEKKNAAGEKLESVYREAMAGLQKQYDAVIALHNHSGVDGITGRFAQWVGDKDSTILGTMATIVAPQDALNALALYKQIEGARFLAALMQLKKQSATGASGLGAVSNSEGDRVVSEAAALSREQDTASMREQIATYANFLEGFAQRLADAAAKDGIQPIMLATKALSVPRGRTRPKPSARPATELPVPPVTPKQAPRPVVPPSGATGTAVQWERGPDGKLRRKQ